MLQASGAAALGPIWHSIRGLVLRTTHCESGISMYWEAIRTPHAKFPLLRRRMTSLRPSTSVTDEDNTLSASV
jgi:hypothetical protein